MKQYWIIVSLLLSAQWTLQGQSGDHPSRVWVADHGDGTYKNPVLHADYSDPDIVRVGDHYYMVASSFNCVPGLPVLHSRDLINWQLIGHALHQMQPADVFNKPQHGKGVWAPCIRYHNNEFYIFYPDPDFGIFMIKATHPGGPWSEPHLVAGGKGFIDPSPLWDEDGKAYLVYAFAGSRAGVKSVLMVDGMAPDGSRLFGQPVMVFDGSDEHPTVEGPKFYKRNGWYYLFAPAGGVSAGWQLVLRSRNVYGPYACKTVMHQGNSVINGPHQGGWVSTPSGEYWFLHFQEKGAYGRVVHLNPMQWIGDWPVIGEDRDGDGCGEPVTNWRKPNVGRNFPVMTPPESDEFNGTSPGKQWQWHANPQIYWGFPSGNLGFYRLNCVPKPAGIKNLWEVPNLFLQKLPAEEFTATVKIVFKAHADGEETGLLMMGTDYQYISLKQENKELLVRVVRCRNAEKGSGEEILHTSKYNQPEIWLRVTVLKGAVCQFAFREESGIFNPVGPSFAAKPGKWIGAKVGLFALRDGFTNDAGTVDVDWFRIEKAGLSD